MITRSWLGFKFCLGSLAKCVKAAVSSYDGIFADSAGFTIFIPDTEDNQLLVDGYLNSLSEEAELNKLLYPTLVNGCLQEYKYTLLTKHYSELTVVDRKFMLNLPLTEAEISSIVAEMS